MGKRMTDADMWTKKAWFMKLKPKYKLFWFYIKDNCDAVGVWDENIELANFVIKDEYFADDLLQIFSHQIKKLPNGKWWIMEFCDFQYGILKEDSTSKPILSYISLLKKHNLWIGYTKGIDTLKEKEQDKDIDKEKDKDKELAKREHNFRDQVKQFKDYPESMLTNFADYWTEPNKSKSKMLFELKPTWDLKRRLKAWADRDNKTPGKKFTYNQKCDMIMREGLKDADFESIGNKMFELK